jgi:hypothetical protein
MDNNDFINKIKFDAEGLAPAILQDFLPGAC